VIPPVGIPLAAGGRVSEAATSPGEPSAANPRELFEAIVESATGFAVFTFGRDGTATSWNSGAERLLGYKEEEIVGRDADVIFTSEDRSAGAPDDERRTAREEGRAEDERWHLRKNGSRFWGSGLCMPLRRGDGFVKILRDLTKRHEAQERLRENEAKFRVLATTIQQLVFLTRPDGVRTWGSPQWIDFTGYGFDESLNFGWLDAVHPDDREATLAAWREAEAKGEHYSEQRVRRASDGEYRWHQTRARPIDTDVFGPGEWVGTSTDIHELKTLQGRQTVLVAELQHRTRNLLAVVQSIAQQTTRSSASVEAFAAQFQHRLRALGRVQGLLARVDHGDVDLREIVEAELAAHRDALFPPDKIVVDGPSVPLPAEFAQAMALALHELATNAVKHGALAQPTGRLAVEWRLDDAGLERRVFLRWTERGVAMPGGGAPARKGYGRQLIERALPYQLKARTSFEFGADGVRCSIAVPVAAGGGKADG
jgi:PAS domain S-box-containing protein